MIRQTTAGNETLRLGGLLTMLFSMALAVIILFGMPSSYVGSILLVLVIFLFLAGGIVFLFDRFILKRSGPKPRTD